MIAPSKSQPLVATCARGLEMVLADELRGIGVDGEIPLAHELELVTGARFGQTWFDETAFKHLQ